MADAMAQSVNTVAVRVGELVGSDNIYDFVTDSLHITSFTEKDRDLGPMVLGSSTYGVTPYELAGAYMMFGSGGTFTTLHSYESVQTGTGKELLTPVIQTEQVISSDTAWVMNRMLKGVMEGAGNSLRLCFVRRNGKRWKNGNQLGQPRLLVCGHDTLLCDGNVVWI